MQDHDYLNKQYKIIAIDLSKYQMLNVDPKAILSINFRGNLSGTPVVNTTVFLIVEKAKDTILDVSQGTAKVL